jgi:hypothetical protein
MVQGLFKSICLIIKERSLPLTIFVADAAVAGEVLSMFS